MIISNERLREIDTTQVEDFEDLTLSVRELAAAVLERSIGSPATSATPAPPAPPELNKRLPGKPLGDKLPFPCPRCHTDVVTFVSRKSGKPYTCDVEMGYIQNKRMLLTAANWLHNCPGAKS